MASTISRKVSKMVNIDDLTYGDLKKIAEMFSSVTMSAATPKTPERHSPIPVIVCTDKRGVVFGYCEDTTARPIILAEARMCLYWSADVGGVFGLGERGPSKGCKISAVLPSISLEGVTAIFSVDSIAEEAWRSAKVQGR